MRSSGSTPSRSPEGTLRRFVLVVGDDHPKACTGRRLLHRGLAEPFPHRPHGPPPLVLDPFAREPLSPRDRPAGRRGGLLVVDCSWNRLSARGRFSDGPRGAPTTGVRRRLPLLVAANPQHFGRLAELNSAEALSAALFVLGEGEVARRLIEGFPGGTGFLPLNRERLEAYARADDADGVLRAERWLFGPERATASGASAGPGAP